MDNGSGLSGGSIFLELLTVAFIVLKLCKVIDWSWWLVLLPAYGLLVVVLAIYAVVFAVAARSK